MEPKRTFLPLLGTAILVTSVLAGCTTNGMYQGAVFTQVDHIGLQAKSDPRTGVPISLKVGVDHALFAMTPQQNFETRTVEGKDGAPVSRTSASGETGALLARSSLEAEPLMPSMTTINRNLLLRKTASEQLADDFNRLRNAAASAGVVDSKIQSTLDQLFVKEVETATHQYIFNTSEAGKSGLRARGFFAAGVPAIVAAAEMGATVRVAGDGGKYLSVKTKESAKERIGAAMMPDIGPLMAGPTVTILPQVDQDVLLTGIALQHLSDEAFAKVLAHIELDLDPRFTNLLNASKVSEKGVLKAAYRDARGRFLENATTDEKLALVAIEKHYLN